MKPIQWTDIKNRYKEIFYRNELVFFKVWKLVLLFAEHSKYIQNQVDYTGLIIIPTKEYTKPTKHVLL